MQVFILGEAMLEYRAPAASGALSYGGDTLNTALHLARMGAKVAYISALGADPFSAALRQAWQHEGVDTRWVLEHPTRQPGIYAIHNDEAGERSFLYWREQSAARDMFGLADMEPALEVMSKADLVYCSLISLAILPEPARKRLFSAVDVLRASGGRFAFDSNYRPGLWPNRETALACSEQAVALADIGLPTQSDEEALHGCSLSAEEVAAHWLKGGANEVAVKTGSNGCLLADRQSPHPVVVRPHAALTVLDSSGAGDAFNAGYLMARIGGETAEAAGSWGHAVAAWVIQRPGAIPRKDADAPYDALRRCACARRT